MASHKVVLHFPLHQLNRPVVNDLVRTYDLEFNILRAEVTPDEKGFVALELTGDTDKFKAGIAWVEELGVTVEPLSEVCFPNYVELDDEDMTHAVGAFGRTVARLVRQATGL